MTLPAGELVPLRRRHYLLAAGIGLAAALICAAAYLAPGKSYLDLEYLYTAAHGFLNGRDPYAAVTDQPHLPLPLFYPMPAVLAMLPLAWMPMLPAVAAFGGLSAFALALAGFRQRGHALLGALLGAGCWIAIIVGQWSPLLTAAAVFPWLGALWVAKPSIGLAMAIAYPSRRAYAGCLALLALSFLVLPSWLGEWRVALGSNIQFAPVVRPGGFLILLALLRWRRPEGRLMAALACIPHMTVLYETVPLFLVPRTRPQAYLLATLTLVCAVLQQWLVPGVAIVPTTAARWPFVFVLVWLPALAMVLARPNEGELPEWIRHPFRAWRAAPAGL